MHDIHTGEVTGTAFGGQGIIRHEGLVIFIPFAAIGDTVRFRIVKCKKNFAFGELVDIITPSTQRITAKCPYFGTCGGCQLQHLNYDTQLQYKRQWIEDALKRQAGLHDAIVPNVEPATLQWAYRRRIVLTLKPYNDSYQAGYFSLEGTSLINVQQCPIFTNETDPTIAQVQALVARLKRTDASDGKVTILKDKGAHFLLHFHFKVMPTNAQQVLNEAMTSFASFSGIVATAPGRSIRVGSFETTLTIGNLTFEFSPQAFIQNHPEQSLNIYTSICKYAAMCAPKKILDLYCGIGISSLMLAQQSAHVIGVEANAEAVRLATENAKNNQITQASFHKANVEAVINNLLKKEAPDLIIVNPPREGLYPQVVDAIIKNPPKHLIYISCMPPTLARDLKMLCQNTYQLDSIKGYDMFPQTAHVETFATLCKIF